MEIDYNQDQSNSDLSISWKEFSSKWNCSKVEEIVWFYVKTIFLFESSNWPGRCGEKRNICFENKDKNKKIGFTIQYHPHIKEQDV
jgi:hypothetical protein